MFLALAIALQESPATNGAQQPPGFSWTPLILILGVVYFVLIAPERKNRKKRDEMLGGLKKGDKVMTTSGMLGSVSHVNGDTVTLQVADNVKLKFTIQAVQSLVEDPAEKAEGKEIEAKAKA